MFLSICPVFSSFALVSSHDIYSARIALTDAVSANTLDTIPAPLLDRMEVLEVSGYVSEEKCVIADKYLGPQAKEASGLKDADVLLDPSTVDVLIKYYCRESGVRNLKKHIDKVRFHGHPLLSSLILPLGYFADIPESSAQADPGSWRGRVPRTNSKRRSI